MIKKIDLLILYWYNINNLYNQMHNQEIVNIIDPEIQELLAKPKFDWEKYEAEQKLKAQIPDKYKEILNSILYEMEAETGEMYQFTIDTFGVASNYNTKLGKFEDRKKKIEIYGMVEAYTELNGVYDSRDEAIKKIEELRCNDLFEETKDRENKNGIVYKIGKCKKCHSYNESDTDGNSRAPNYIDINVCQTEGCDRGDFDSKWSHLEISKSDYDIYECFGGSLSICKTKGHYKFI
jgi:hypothetical protein